MPTGLLLPHALPADATPHRLNGLRPIPAGETITIADIKGPGCVHHFFITLPPRQLRKLVLRFYWDGEETPSIESPLPDFFGIGHDLTTAELRTSLFYVAPKYGYNCYIPMPFARNARITVTNECPDAVPAIYWQMSVSTYDAPVPAWRLHCAWRRVMPAYRRGAPFTVAEARGEGRLLALLYHICKRDSDDRWSHGGADQVFIDGDTARPGYIYGIGGEDFAHHAWGLYPAHGPYTGCHMCHPVPDVKCGEGMQAFEPHGWEQHDGGRYSMYRFFIPDPIPFKNSMRFTFGTCANEISATTYWYQSEPHTPFATLPPPQKRIFGARAAEEETWTPIPLAGDIPVAVLGPMKPRSDRWSPDQPVKLDQVIAGDIEQPYGDVVRPPWNIRWRRSGARGGFLDLAAIHRPKAALRARGLWNYRHIPFSSASCQLIRVKLPRARKLTLRLGFEDRVAVWLNGRKLADMNHPDPALWATEDVSLKLAAGVNDIVLECSHERWCHWSAWGIYVRFLTPAGKPADDLAFDPFKSLDATPERWREKFPAEDDIRLPEYRDPLYFV